MCECLRAAKAGERSLQGNLACLRHSHKLANGFHSNITAAKGRE
jgi:hypothetical protein